MPEVRQFTLHKNLFYNVVLRQAGSLEKALLEGVMNSIDAKATKCVITITDTQVIIKDDGQGFRTRAELERCFEVFGQPHDENEHKVYAQFRIGRGQMMAYGINTWRSGEFRMKIDVKGRGMDYDLEDGLKKEPGCTITIDLYEQLMPSQLEEVTRTLSRWVQYAPIPVRINGHRVNKRLDEQKWDIETDDAYIKLTGGGGIDVYNQGIFVMSLSRWHYGTGGVVVTKGMVKVNFARNDIQSDCPIWKRIKPLIDQRTTRDLTRKKVLDDDGRAALIKSIIERKLTLDDGTRQLKLITAVTGRHYPLDALYDERWQVLSMGYKGDVKPCRVHESKRAFVISTQTINEFSCGSVENLQRLLNDRSTLARVDFAQLPVVPIEELVAGMSDSNEPLSDNQLRDREKVWLQLIRAASQRSFHSRNKFESRRYMIGKSDSNDGWTDAKTYVALNRDFLKEQDYTVQGFGAVGHVVLHELCHIDPDIDSHEHDQEFFQRYHDNSPLLATFIDQCLRLLPLVFKTFKRRMDKKALYQRDKVAKLERTDTSIVGT